MQIKEQCKIVTTEELKKLKSQAITEERARIREIIETKLKNEKT